MLEYLIGINQILKILFILLFKKVANATCKLKVLSIIYVYSLYAIKKEDNNYAI